MSWWRGARQLAHRYLWQALPQRCRRAALVAISRRLAPRPSPMPDRDGPYVVAGYLTAASGLGQWARLTHEALRRAGRPVLGIDLAPAFMQDGERVRFDFSDGSRHTGPGKLLLHVNAPFAPLALWQIGRAQVRSKLVVGFWAWELPKAPDEWRAGVRFVHQVVVPSRFTRQAIATLSERLPVAVLALPVAMADVPGEPAVRDPGQGAFHVLIVFNMASGFARKNVLAGIEAFEQAFGSDGGACLTIKMLNGDSRPEQAALLGRRIGAASNIRLDQRTLGDADMRCLYAQADVVLSLHRAEGFGLVLAEAMLAGRPIVATDWSGNCDFATAANGMPVPARLVPAIDDGYEYHQPDTLWAEPDVGFAAQALRRLRADAELRQRLGMRGRADALEHFAAAAYLAGLDAVVAGSSAGEKETT